MSTILVIDLGKRHSVTCTYDLMTHEHAFGKVATRTGKRDRKTGQVRY